jgi:hypothetical protein
MANFGSFLVGLASPIAKRVIGSLGMGVLTYSGLTAGVNLVVSNVQSLMTVNNSPLYQLLMLLGAGQSMGIILGGLVARVTYMSISRIGRLT